MKNLVFVVDGLVCILLWSVLQSYNTFLESKVEMLQSVSPAVHWRVEDADSHVCR